MRICFLADAASVHTQRWATYFAARGDEVIVLSARDGAIPGVRVIAFGAPLRGRARFLAAAPAAAVLMRAIRPDILHAHYARSYGFIGALTGFRRLVVSAWGSDVCDERAERAPYAALLRFTFRRASAICATSAFLTERTRHFVSDGRSIEITPFGVDLSTFYPVDDRAPGPARIATARARLDPIYGIDTLIEAYARLPVSLARLVLYGGGDHVPALRRRVDVLGLRDRVAFAGTIDHARMPTALRAVDIFAMPSVVPEAFGVAAVEAAATGLPVVASHVGGLPEVVEDGITGHLVAPGDVDALAAQLERLSGDADLRARLGAAGRALIKRRYDWAKNAALMADLYERVRATI
ncbi:MAG: glycosyltransferase family 4 protein [Chloroflexota bacterium]|nr:MAG: glycosyltransferase family 4 protein [Chloroflexota bacterium]